VFESTSELLFEFRKILILRAVIALHIEVHAGALLAEEDNSAANRVRVAQLVVNTRTFSSKVREQEFRGFNLLEHARRYQSFVLDVVSSNRLYAEVSAKHRFTVLQTSSR